jgi:hypothetical protein
MSEDDETRDTIIGEYRKRYPDWSGIHVPALFKGFVDVGLAVVKANGNNEGEICFFDSKHGVRIFSTDEELAQSLVDKAKMPVIDKWRRQINLGIAVVSLVGIAVLIAAVWFNRSDAALSALVTKNFAAIAGLPFAFVASFVVVALFRQGESAVDFDAFGVKLKGAAGEIILWLLCFVAISGSISLLWKSGS